MSTGDEISAFNNAKLVEIAKVFKFSRDIKEQLWEKYYGRIIELQNQLAFVDKQIDEKLVFMYVNYVFYIASVESMLLYLYIGYNKSTTVQQYQPYKIYQIYQI